jgi:hypothetical protein
VAKRRAWCVFGAGVHVGQARDLVFVEVAPHVPVAGGGALIAYAPMHIFRAIYVWPLPSP